MNKIYKVIYSKVRQCYVVVSEIAKSHGRHTKSSVAKSNVALTAAVLIALGGISFITNPEVAYADLPNANGYYLGISDADTSRTKDDNANGKGATGTDSITIGHNSTAGTGTITIGDRSAGGSMYSVYLGEHYTSANQTHPDTGKYVTSIGYDSDAKGTGSIALGSGAEADVNRASEGHEQNSDAHSASVAIGYQAKANQNNIAIGAKSVASDKASTTAAAFTNQAAPKSYVSVGDGIKDSETQYRRITNVADGAEKSDVATVGQLQALAAKSGTYKAGFGIEITPDTTTKENTIKLSRNLGRDMDSTDKATLVADESKSALVLGGRVEEGQSKKGQVVEKPYGAFGQDSVVVGGANNIADKDGLAAVVVGGTTNTASAQYSTVAGGNNNDAFGNESSVFGGFDNDAFGPHATLSGGSMNKAHGEAASVFGGAMNSALGDSSVAVGGLQSTVNGAFAVGIAGGSTNANHALAAGNGANVTVENGTAIGYQATTDEANTIAFGHDAGDVSGYTIKWKQRTDGKTNADHTTNDYTQVPDSVTPTTYKDAYYNRLVKVADGVDDHDVVVMEQLKPYTKSDASNIGNNLKTYTVGDDGETITEADATGDQKKANKDAWGTALGADTFSEGTPEKATDASNSKQLVTGNTLYNYDKPTGSPNYVNANNTTGQNLSALDAQVKSNAEALNDKTHNIKYYSVNDQNSISRTPKTLPTMKGLADNSDNKGAKGMGSLASGFNTEADGTLSTVGGSYSGVINEGSVPYLPPFLNVDIRGTTAVSYGTGNINKSTAQSGRTSGVANSLIGQVNDVTDSNAAIAIGAGNTISNSYRDVTINPMEVYNNSHNPEALRKLMQDAVKESGGQVMVMGGGNSVDKAYMTQVVGVGNKVTGHDTTYAEGTSTQYNYVDGFQNTLTNGKNDYIIGANNSVTGDSIDKNQSNIVVGDNHTLKNRKNNVVIGSADKKENKNKELTASDATVIGHNADVTVDGGVAIGSGSVSTATDEAYAEGYDPVSTKTNKASTNSSATWKATTGAVSIGGVNGNTTTTRRITNLAAGFNDTDAVNVAQIKKLASINASNIGDNLQYEADGTTAATDTDKTENKKAWATAIGTGTVTKDDDGSKQMVTGKTVYDALHGGLDNITVGKDGQNGKDGSIGIAGQNGKDGYTMTIIKTEKGADGVDGKNGQDGITRIVYQDKDDTTGKTKQTVATLDDGLKFMDDFGTTAKVKLDNVLNVVGDINQGVEDESKKKTADALSTGNIGVVATDTTYKDDGTVKTPGKLTIKLAKDLKGMNSTEYTSGEKTGEGDQQKTTTTINSRGLTITDGPSITKDGIDAGNKAITQVASGLGNQGSYNEEQNGTNAANLNDVNKMITDATASGGTIGNELYKKANVDATNIGTNLSKIPVTDANGNIQYDESGAIKLRDATDDDKTANENAWGNAIGTGHVANPTEVKDSTGKVTNDPTKNGSQQLITGGEVYNTLHGGLDNITVGKDGKDGKDGSIGIAGRNGTNGYTMTIIKTEQGTAGVDGKDGITRVIYQDKDGSKKHTIATMEDGLKFAGDDGQKDATKAIAKKLNNTLDIIGGAKGDLTENNIGVNNVDGKLKIQLAKDLKGITSISGSTDDKGAKLTLDTKDKNISVNGGKITNLAPGKADTDAATVKQVNDVDAKANANSEAIKTNASNIEKNGKAIEKNTSAIQTNAGNIEKNGKAIEQNSAVIKTNSSNIEKNSKAIEKNSAAIQTNASNIEKNSKAIEQNSAAIKTNAGNIEKNSKAIEQNTAAIKTNAGNIEKNGKAIEQNSAAIKTNSSNIEKISKTVEQTSAQVATNSSNIEKNGAAIEKNSAAIKTNSGNIEKNTAAIESLGQNKANINASNIGKNLKDADGKAASDDAVKANEDAWGDAIGTGKVESGNNQLVTGDTVYSELRPTADGSYIKKDQTTAQNLTNLDTQVKKNSDLINSDGKTIKIGGSNTATKIDVSGKDSSGNSTSRVITGVKTDTSDRNSAANVGYVNDMAAASTQQIYQDMNSAYSHVENDISRAAAGSNALAALHPMQEFDPDDKAQYALGYGHYRNSNAGAVGVFYQPDENSLFSLGASFGNGDAGINAGVTFKFGPGGSGHHALTKTQMAKVIDAQSKEIDALKKDNADKDKRIDALEQKVNEILAKVEKDKA